LVFFFPEPNPHSTEPIFAAPQAAARNAVGLRAMGSAAKQTGKRVWELAGLPKPGPEIHSLHGCQLPNLRDGAHKLQTRFPETPGDG